MTVLRGLGAILCGVVLTAVGLAAPASAILPPVDGYYTFNQDGLPPARWTDAEHLHPAQRHPRAARLHRRDHPDAGLRRDLGSSTPSLLTREEQLVNFAGRAKLTSDLWTFQITQDEGLACADGSSAPTTDTFAFTAPDPNGPPNVTGTHTSIHGAVCGLQPAMTKAPFTLTFTDVLDPAVISRYPACATTWWAGRASALTWDFGAVTVAERTRTRRSHSGGAVTKSISSSTRPISAGSRSFQSRTRDRIRCQARAMSAWLSCGQPSAAQMPCFQSTLRGITGQSLQPEPLGFDGLPDVDVGVADHQACAPPVPRRTASAMRASFEPVTRWSTSTPEPAPRAGLEVGDDAGQIVDAAEVLDDDALDAQVVAPDLLDEFGVVAALHVDPAGQRRTWARAPGTATEPEAVRVGAGPRAVAVAAG